MAISQHRSLVNTRRLFALLGLLLALLLLGHLLAPRAFGFDARNGERLTIGAGETINDDLYLAAQTIVIDGTVQGDVVAAAQTITVNGTIEGSLIAAAQTLILNGTVRDTARLAGQAVVLEPPARVGRDLVVFAYSVENRAGSAVGRDVTIGAYQALLTGNVARNVVGGMAGLEIQGTVGGDVNVTVGTNDESTPPTMAPVSPPPAVVLPFVRPGLTVADSANIAGRVIYEAPRNYAIGGKIGQGVTWNQRAVEQPIQPGFGSVVADNVRRLVALAVIGMLFLRLALRPTQELAATIQVRPLPSLGWGFVAAFAASGVVTGVAIATVLLAVALGALTLGSLAGLVVVLGLLGDVTLAVGLTVFAAYVAQALASYLTGQLLLRQFQPALLARRYTPFLIGLPVFVIVTALPGVGGLIGLLVAIMAMGAIWIRVRDRGEPAPAAMPSPVRTPLPA
jgi:cytoskeletal protein CcmA (bactofilin family)